MLYDPSLFALMRSDVMPIKDKLGRYTALSLKMGYRQTAELFNTYVELWRNDAGHYTCQLSKDNIVMYYESFPALLNARKCFNRFKAIACQIYGE